MTRLKHLIALAIVLTLFLFSVQARAVDLVNRVQVHGFVSQGYLYSTENDFLADSTAGSFEFNEVGINFTTQPIEKLRIGVQFFSRDLGELDNNRIDLDWAFADYRLRNELGIRIGKFKQPMGLLLETIDLDMTRTTIFLPISCYEPRWRATLISSTGVSLYGTVGIGFLGSIEYNGSVGTNIFPSEALESQFQELMETEEITERLVYGGRLIWHTPLRGLLVGGSYHYVEDLIAKGTLLPELTAPITALGGMSIYPAGTEVEYRAKSIEVWYAFLRFNYQKLIFTGEYMQLTPKAEIATSEPYNPLVGALTGFTGIDAKAERSAGWYAQADYQFLDWLTAAVNYGEFYSDIDDLDGSNYEFSSMGYQKDTSLSLRFDVNPHWNIKVEGHYINGTALAYYATRNTETEKPEENWMFFAAKTSFYF